MKTSFYSAAKERMGDLKDGMLNNPALKEGRAKLEKVQKKFTQANK